MDLYGEVARITDRPRQQVKSLCWPKMYSGGFDPTVENLVAYVEALLGKLPLPDGGQGAQTRGVPK